MSLVLSRVDYTNVGVTSRGSMKILPSSSPKVAQKFVVGDHDGILHIFSMKKNELQIIFKSLPGYKIEKVVLGGGATDTIKDKIFIAYGNTVKGLTKKGKMFLEFDTNLMETINAMDVLGSDLAVCARDIYHRYRNCKDADSYLVGETLNDVILMPTNSGKSVVAVLACGDRAIRILSGTKKPTIVRLPSVPTVLSAYRENGKEYNDRILVGTQDGKIGLFVMQSVKTVRITWLINTYGSEITSLDTYELDDSADVDIIIGRQDGTIEIFNFSGLDDGTVPMLRFQYNAGESISTVAGGVIGTPGHTEVLVSTYSGKIFGLTTKPPGALEADAAASEAEMISKLEAEIRQLKVKLNEMKEYDHYSTTVDTFKPLILSINHRMTLIQETSTYLLSIELDAPIDYIFIQSNTLIELLDESNNAVLSLSATDSKVDGNYVLATYRCQVNTNQLETKIKTIEGESGTLQVYVTSQIQPKCCRKIKIPIFALSLHVRIHDDENTNENLFGSGPLNELRLSGSFTVAEMHAWLSLALPDISERPNLKDNEVKLNYKSIFIGSTLQCTYKKGSAEFLSENISTIVILRDLLTKEATKRKIKLDATCNAGDAALKKMLELVIPQLNSAHEIVEKFKIVNALQNLEMTDNPTENLCTYYQELLEEEDNIRSKYLINPNILEQIQGVITNLYIDWQRAKGHQRLTSAIAEERLSDALKLRDMTLILGVFMDKNDNSNNPTNNESPTPTTSTQDS